MACTGSGGKGTASVCKCMSNIGSTWNAYCHEIIITLTVTLLKVRTMTYMSWYVMICHVSCILFLGSKTTDSKRIFHDIHPCLAFKCQAGAGEVRTLPPLKGDPAHWHLSSVSWRLAPSTAVDDHQHIFFKRYEDMSRIYETDLWRIQTPPQGLAFWLWLYWAWGSLERSSTVQWNWCAVLTALERLWMKWKLMKHHDSNHDSQVKIQSQ